MNLTKKTISGGFVRLTSLIIKGVLQLVVLSFFSRIIPPEDFGVITIITSMLVFVTMFTEIGLGPALIQRHDINQKHISVAFSTSLLFSLFSYGLLFLSAPLIANFYKEPELIAAIRFASLSFVFTGLGVVSISLLRKELDFKKIMIVDLLSFVLSYGLVGISLVLQGAGIWAYIISIVAQSLISSVLFYIFKPHSIALSYHKLEFKELFHFAGSLTMEKVFNNIGRQGDVFLTGKFLGMSSLGIYGRASQLMDIPNQYIGQALDNVLFPAMSKKQNQKEILKTTYLHSISIVNLFMFPASIFAILLAPEITLLVFGKEWAGVTVPLQILCVVLPFKTSVKVTDSLVRALGAFYRSAIVKLIYAIAVIVITLFSWRWGLNGIAIGVDVALLINYTITSKLAQTLTDYVAKEYAITYLPALTLSLIVVVFLLPVVYCARHYWFLSTLEIFSLATLTIIGVMAIFLMFFPQFFGKTWNWVYGLLINYIPGRNPFIVSLKLFFIKNIKSK